MEITTLNLFEYYIIFAGHQTALSNRYARQALENGNIFAAKTEGGYAGYICVGDEVENVRINYAFTLPQFRGRGVFTALTRHLQHIQSKPVRTAISSGHSCYEPVRHVLLKLGFIPSERVVVYSCSRKDEEKWHQFMEKKGKRLCEMLEMHGYSAVSFQDMDEGIKKQLVQSDKSEFANIFHPDLYLEDESKLLSWDLSYAAVKEGTLAAYCLVSMGNSKSAMFDQISVSAAELGRGVILLPYVYSMQRFFERGLDNAYYAMYGSNSHASAFRNKILNIFPTTESTLENYVYLNNQDQ